MSLPSIAQWLAASHARDALRFRVQDGDDVHEWTSTAVPGRAAQRHWMRVGQLSRARQPDFDIRDLHAGRDLYPDETYSFRCVSRPGGVAALADGGGI